MTSPTRLPLIPLLALCAGCFDCGGFAGDPESDPFGPLSPTSQTTLRKKLAGQGELIIVARSLGTKKVGGRDYVRWATADAKSPDTIRSEVLVSDIPLPTSGSFTVAGYDSPALGITATPATPVSVRVDPPVGVPQPFTLSTPALLPGGSALQTGTATGSYTLVADNVAVDTPMGPVTDCRHYSGTATATHPDLPPALQGIPLTGEVWYSPTFGLVAAKSPTTGLDVGIAQTSDVVEKDGWVTMRKVAVIDAQSPSFSLSSYDAHGAFDADKDTHAIMVLELRWADEASAKATAPGFPMVTPAFGTVWGHYDAVENKTGLSFFHPSENGKGFKYATYLVNQAAKNEPVNGIAYTIRVNPGAGTPAIRATARLHYKLWP